MIRKSSNVATRIEHHRFCCVVKGPYFRFSIFATFIAHGVVWEHRGICTPHRASLFFLILSLHNFCPVSFFFFGEGLCTSGLWVTRRYPSVLGGKAIRHRSLIQQYLGGKHIAWLKFRTLLKTRSRSVAPTLAFRTNDGCDLVNVGCDRERPSKISKML